MSLIFRISLRNLIRQKRRNLLLGTAIAFGTMILVLAGAFSHGISDVLFNKVMKYVTGHVSVVPSENGNLYTTIFRDGDRILEIVNKNVPEMTQFSEAIGVFCHGIGNGKSDNLILVGVDLSAKISKEELKETMENFKMVEGSFEDLGDTTVENGVILADSKAKYLNLKKGDILRVRFTDVNGQNQAERLTVIGIFKPSNAFMAAPMFVEMRNAKRILGYGPHDIAQLYITIKDPKKNAIIVANRLHALLKPPVAVIDGRTLAGDSVAVAGYRTDTLYLKNLLPAMQIVAGDSAAAMGKRGVLIGQSLAAKLKLKPGDTCTVTYTNRHTGEGHAVSLPIDAMFASRKAGLSDSILLVNECRFYDTYYHGWPVAPSARVRALLPQGDSTLTNALAPEWVLLDRCRTTAETKKRYKEISLRKWCAATLDVQSMYESGSDVLKLESALTLITLIAVLVLFFIILIGVVNTLRMTIRERTREIGTMRAIGMQKTDVRNSFIMETFLLALFSAAAGTALSFAAMAGLSLIKFKVDDNPFSMLLVGGHLHFMPTVVGTIGYVALILVISVATAYFPSRRAANLHPSEALRHYE